MGPLKCEGVAQRKRQEQFKKESKNRFISLSLEDDAEEMRVICSVEGKADLCGMLFHVTDVNKILASVGRITEAGNTVAFGPKEHDNYIENLTTGKKILMKKKR